MTRPTFLWDLLVKIGFAIFGIVTGALFWMLAASFLLINLFLSWDKLWRYLGVWNLAMYRFIMRRRNLYDTSLLPTKPSQPDPRALPWNPACRTARTADGTFNDLQDPLMGSAHTRFARNFPLKRLNELFTKEIDGDYPKMLSPNPREISRSLLTRDRFKPASSLNLFAAAWIQFQVHDWFNHRRRLPDQNGNDIYLKPIPLDPQDDWPGRQPGEKEMRIRCTLPDESVHRDSPEFGPGKDYEGVKGLPIYRNSETHWWDGSQLYGSSQEKQHRLRAQDGSGKLRIEEKRLPADPDRRGVDLTGFNDNWWAGLNLMHTLFALEHNAICDRLKEAYPDWPEERLFQTARLINTALIAKIHTVEWTPAILGHPTLYIGMRANWWGILTQRVTKIIGRLRMLRDVQEEVTGIPGSEQDHHASPFYLTEEFVAVYRMHPLIPDDYRIYNLETDELKVACSFNDLHEHNTRDFVQQVGAANLCYSFGVTHPGAITLRNFPRALQHFRRMKDENHDFGPEGEPLDLGTIDIMRDRERAVPRYNHFRRMLMMLPCISYERLVGVPLLRWFSSLTNRQIEERKAWARLLQKMYPDKEDLDLMIGLHAEHLPEGFGFSDTAFRIFVLMAPRRLKSDRFITTDFNPDVYTPTGMDWVEQNSLKTVLLRHYPALTPALDDVKNAFTPWQRTERPAPDPVKPDPLAADPRPEMRRVSIFQMPIFGGAFVGWLIGALYAWKYQTADHPITLLGSFYEEKAVYGAAIGAILGGACLSILYLISFISTRELTLREQTQTGAGVGSTIGWLIGAWFNLWSHGVLVGGLHDLAVAAAQSMITPEALIAALIGTLAGFARRQATSQAFIGACIGWLAGSGWTLFHTPIALPWEDLRLITEALSAREAVIVAFIGATVGIAIGGRKTLRDVFVAGGVARFIQRGAYGALFGALIGGLAGTLLGILLALYNTPASLFVTVGIGLAAIATGIACCVASDFLVKRNWQWPYVVLSVALSATAIAVLIVEVLPLAGGGHALLASVLPTLDAVTFWLVSFAICAAALGVLVWLLGWVAVAALGGWLLGATAQFVIDYESILRQAIFSGEAGTGILLGAFLGLSLTIFLVREWLWAVVWCLRGAFLGLIAGVLYYLFWGTMKGVFLPNVIFGFVEALGSQTAFWGALLVALLVGGIWIVRGPEITWILRGGFWRFLGWFKFAGNRPVSIPLPRRRWWWKPVVWLKFFADRRIMTADENGNRLVSNLWRCVKRRLENRLRNAKASRSLDRIPDVPFKNKFPIPIDHIRVSGLTPIDERAIVKDFFSRVQVNLFSIFSPMQPDRPLSPISSNPLHALQSVYGFLQRKAFDPPDLPPEYQGSPDLGSLAVRGPYSSYLHFMKGTEQDPQFEWNLLDLRKFEVHPESCGPSEPSHTEHSEHTESKPPSEPALYSLGVRVLFRMERSVGIGSTRLEAYQIDHQTSDGALRTYRPLDPAWQFAKQLALCAVTTHLSLVRHFNWVHLASSEPLAIATRNHLPSDHAVCRLLWPHIYGTQQSNSMVTLVQMVKNGDFESIFSFTHKGLCELFEETYKDFTFIVNDPEEDAIRRGVRPYLQELQQAGVETSQHNLEALFEVIHRHVQRYLKNHYSSDSEVQHDAYLRQWVEKLNELIPNGIGVSHNSLTVRNVSRVIARFIYLVTVQHELVGTFLWNYQLWTHRQPIRVYKSGRREPLDVYQRLVNANFNLNVKRRALMDDFSYMALDDHDAAAFREFQNDLKNLQERMDKDPWEVWKIYPKMLEANINA